MSIFKNREDAGRQLGRRLKQERLPNAILIALPRGGLPVVHAAANELDAPWGMVLVRKLRSLRDPEFALGAIAEGGDPLWSPGAKGEDTEEIERRARAELDAQAEKWMHFKLPPVANRPVIIVDDGLATGWTARAAARRLRKEYPSAIWGAFPVGPPETVAALSQDFDHVICPHQPANFRYVAQFYEDFQPVSDKEAGLPRKK